MRQQAHSNQRTIQTLNRHAQAASRLFILETIGVLGIAILLPLKASVPLGLLILILAVGTLLVYMNNILCITRICMEPRVRRHQAALSLAALTALYPLLALILFVVRIIDA